MNIKNTLADTVMEYICRILLIGTLIYLIVRWNTIPDQIPIHYNAAGDIDGWGRERNGMAARSYLMGTLSGDYFCRTFPGALEYRGENHKEK